MFFLLTEAITLFLIPCYNVMSATGLMLWVANRNGIQAVESPARTVTEQFEIGDWGSHLTRVILSSGKLPKRLQKNFAIQDLPLYGPTAVICKQEAQLSLG